jgi:hypothetical protein
LLLWLKAYHAQSVLLSGDDERILETKKAAPGEVSGHRYRIALAAVCMVSSGEI